MLRRLALIATLGLLGGLSARPASTQAATDQVAMLEENSIVANPGPTVAALAALGVQDVRLFMLWRTIAPQPYAPHPPLGFDGADPAAYPTGVWAAWDQAIKTVQAAGMSVELDVSGDEPLWAAGRGMPRGQMHLSWEPNAGEYGEFFRAVAERYSGDYDPQTDRLDPGDPNDLPRVSFWSIWNEPNYGPSLAPQGVLGHLSIDHSPEMYRRLVDVAWRALGATGHRGDTVLFGELAPRGYPGTGRIHFGVFNEMKPLAFLRSLYCLDGAYRPLTGAAARVRGCPTTAAGRRAFRGAHPALFEASGFAIHPYSRWFAPNLEIPNDPDYASLADVGQLTRTLDRIQRAYGSKVRFPIWNTEYGYQTDPPKHDSARFPWISPTTAAAYLNQAEYLSWRNPRVASFMQYLLYDPPGQPTAANDWGGFATGLLTWNGTPKPSYDAWRMPVWLPVTTGRRGARLEIWGCARPASFPLRAVPGQPEPVAIEWRPRGHSSFRTLNYVSVTNVRGYFDTRQSIPGSGTIRLQWRYPAQDPAPGPGPGGAIFSRSVAVTLR